eukprot:CAMPEP_0174838296 /NCGR_PEP_ID=MMETSP1114-20130205/7296_1 /TAXON_ID=312471 /ORGANISM="Neobodo designis, Strain CCAP 1951/1" /LENGTH=795 /DNA_ID=CAMNT_0016072391 /DNA_START=265 /DNA_END=2652 /DNA_ORIENTATION=+
MVITITGAKSWGTGYSQTFKPVVTPCEEYQVTVTVGATFIGVSVTNPHVCSYPTPCIPASGDYSKPGCKWAQYRVIAPFALEWVDKSTTATFTLPTRQNTPINIPMEATTLSVPEALDKRTVTNLMELRIRIMPIETTTLESQEENMWGGVPDDLFAFKTGYVDFNRANADRSVGIKYQYNIRYWDPHDMYYGHMYHRRKQPTPPFMFKQRFGDGCDWSPGDFEKCQGPGYGYYHRVHAYPAPANDWNYLRMDCDRYCDSYWINADDGWSWSYHEFYEDFRLRKHTVTVDWAAVKAATQLASNGYATTVDAPDANNQSIKLRFEWRNLTEFRDGSTTEAAEATTARQTVGVYVIPPNYQIQDLWVTVHSDAGKRVFTDMERRVPYRNPNSPTGHVGWMWALTERFVPVTDFTIVVRYNRAVKLGTTEEERRVALLRGFVDDNNGDVSNMTSPIPKTILATEGVMGAVASRAITSGDPVAHISYQSCLTNNITKNFYNRHLAKKMNTSSTWYAYWDTTPTPWHQEHLMMTLMLVTDAVSEDDYSTAFWPIYDAYYPAKPAMLLHFWDPIQVNRLLGFSQLPAIAAAQLAQWATEHAMIAEAWPWFGASISVGKWQRTRAHVLRSTFAQNGELFLPPFVHLLRHAPVTPNLALRAEWHTAQIYVTALADIAFQEELYVDFNAPAFSKHEYFLRYGEVPTGATDATTVPGWTGYLDLTRPSRDVLVAQWMAQYGESQKQALQRVISVLSVKQASMPVNVDGLGSTPEQVNMATRLLNSEKTTLNWQLADANAEYAAMP